MPKKKKGCSCCCFKKRKKCCSKKQDDKKNTKSDRGSAVDDAALAGQITSGESFVMIGSFPSHCPSGIDPEFPNYTSDDGFLSEIASGTSRMSNRSTGNKMPIIQSADASKITSKTASAAQIIGVKRRSKLPAFKDERGFSLWAVLKSAIGKDLSKITMPLQVNEPLSFVQRLAEYMEYSHVLDKANGCQDPVDRMEYVAAFLVSALSTSYKRMGKPFNPVMGETFEYERPDLGFRFMSEQVSHHPPITAFHCEGTSNGGYAFYGNLQPKLKFLGRTLDVTPKGIIRLRLNKFNDEYELVQTESFKILVHNLFSTVPNWLENKGLVQMVKSPGTMRADLYFKTFEGNNHYVEGTVFDKDVAKRSLFGSWIISMFSCAPGDYKDFTGNSKSKSAYIKNFNRAPKERKLSVMSFDFETRSKKTLWIGNEKQKNNEKYYNFTAYAMTLNEMLPGMEASLPRTDSRLRKDMRLMEEGDIDSAQEAKNKIEDKQRVKSSELGKKGQTIKPKWFEERQEEWIFTNKYWNKSFDKTPFF